MRFFTIYKTNALAQKISVEVSTFSDQFECEIHLILSIFLSAHSCTFQASWQLSPVQSNAVQVSSSFEPKWMKTKREHMNARESVRHCVQQIT